MSSTLAIAEAKPLLLPVLARRLDLPGLVKRAFMPMDQIMNWTAAPSPEWMRNLIHERNHPHHG